MTKTVVEAALEEEMADHLGYDKHAVEGRNRGNSRNGKRPKTVSTDSCGEVEATFPATGTASSNRSWSASGNAAWVRSTRWCSASTPRD